MKKLDPQLMIDALAGIAAQNYREGEADRADRLAYHVGLLEGKLRELCMLLNQQMELLHTTSEELKSLELFIGKEMK